jgi:hypothetical protein
MFSVSITYSMPIQHMNSSDMWGVVLPLECVILCCGTVIIFLPRSFIFSNPLLTKKFWVYYGSVKQTWCQPYLDVTYKNNYAGYEDLNKYCH